MEPTEAGPADDDAIPALHDINPATAFHAFGVLQRRMLLAEILDVPAHLLCSSLQGQADHRAGQAQRRWERAAFYRTAMRASATSALTARAVDPVSGLQKQGACTLRDNVGGSSDSDSNRQQNCSCGSGAAAALQTVPRYTTPALAGLQHQSDEISISTPEAAGAAVPSTPVTPAGLTPAASSPTRNRDGPASSLPPVPAPSKLQEADGSPDAAVLNTGAMAKPPGTTGGPMGGELQLQSRTGSPPMWVGSDLTLSRDAWTRLTNAVNAACGALSKAGNARGVTGYGADIPGRGSGGFRAKLQRSDEMELRGETEAALEALREAAIRLPAHKVVWHLEQATKKGIAASFQADTGKAPPQAKLGQGRSTAAVDGQPDAPQPWILYALALMQANVLLCRPRFAATSPGSGSGPDHHSPHCGGAAEATAVAAIAVEDRRRRDHHRRIASLLMEALLRVAGQPVLPYPELAAVAVAQAELCPLLRMDELPPRDGDNSRRVELPPCCVSDRDLPLRLVRRCIVALTAHSRTKARRIQPNDKISCKALSRSGATEWSAVDSGGITGGGAASPSCDGRGRACANGGRVHQAQHMACGQHVEDPQPYDLWLEDAVRPLEELVVAAARAHVEAASAAQARLGQGPVRDDGSRHAQKTLRPIAVQPEVFRSEYEVGLRLQHIGGAAADAVAAGKKLGGSIGGDGRNWAAVASAAAEVEGSPLLSVLIDLPRLICWDSDVNGVGNVRAEGRDRASALGSEEPYLEVGLEQGLALGLWPKLEAGADPADKEAERHLELAQRAAAERRSELAQGILEAMTSRRPRRLVVRGAAALRNVVTAASAAGLMRQASWPHPDAVVGASLRGGHGPVLLRFEITPADRQGPAQRSPGARAAGTLAANVAASACAAAPAKGAARAAAAVEAAASAAAALTATIIITPATGPASFGSRVVDLARRAFATRGKKPAAGKDSAAAGKGIAATGKRGVAAVMDTAAAVKAGARAGKHTAAAGMESAAVTAKCAAAANKGAAAVGKESAAAECAAQGKDSVAAPGKVGAAAGAAAWRPEEHLGQITVTVVPRGAPAGRKIQQLCRFAREARRCCPKSRASTIIEVPPSGFSLLSVDSGDGDSRSGGGAGVSTDGGAPASLEHYKQLLRIMLGDSGCAWLHCPDREALQAAALLVAEVHQDIQQEQRGMRAGSGADSGASTGAQSRATSAGASATASRPPPGLEVLPYLEGPWWDLRIREARDRVMQDLATVMRSPTRIQAQGLVAPQAQPSPVRGTEPGAKTAGGSGADGRAAACGNKVMLDDGWEFVRRLAVNRETSYLIGLLGRGVPPVPLQSLSLSASPSTAKAGAHLSCSRGLENGVAGGSTTASAAASEGGCGPHLRNNGPEAVRLLVVRQRDLERVEDMQAAE